MVTEDEARTLLRRAADTIPVDDATEPALPEAPTRRPYGTQLRRVGVVAAVAVLVAGIAGAGLLVEREVGEDRTVPADRGGGTASDRTEGVERERGHADDEPPEDETIDEAELEQSMSRASSAAEFVAWSRGEGPPPEFADEVRFLVDGDAPFGAPTWVADPTDPDQWAACSGLPAGRCGLDPRWVLGHYDGPVAQSTTRATCPDGGAVPGELAEAAETDLVRLDQPEPATCAEAWAVELWVDGGGAIYAVNLAVAAP